VVKGLFEVLAVEKPEGEALKTLEGQLHKYLSHNYQPRPKLDMVLFFPSLESEAALLKVLSSA